ncbi:MAG: Uma2 family endonuclease, partial [Spirosomataceae bacterium]
EYFKLLAASDVKLEYHDGKIVAMAGAKPTHNQISANFIFQLKLCLRKSNCFVLASDQLIAVPACKKFVFPDVVIVCEKPLFEKNKQGLDALTNPEVIIEVLSDSTELNDRNEKFDCYKTIESFREYVLVSTNRKKIEVYKKINQTEWLVSTFYDKNDEVTINRCKLFLKDIYEQTDQLP